jgi:hypothetical protein
MNRMKRALAILAIVLLAAALAACGGGGGGAQPASVPYTGNSAGAVIAKADATEIALSAYSGGSLSSFELLGMAVTAEGGHASQTPHMGLLVNLTRDLRDLALSPGQQASEYELQAQNYGEPTGECGGKFTWTGTSNLEAANGSVTFSFEEYCNYGTTLTGKVKVSWSNTTFSISFEPLTAVINDYWTTANFTLSGKLDGKLTENQDSWTEVLTTNLVLIDHISELSNKFENYRISSTYSHYDQPDKFVLSGRYYDFEHGRVDISTPQPILVDWYSDWPKAGIIQFNGASSSVRLVYISEGARIEWRASLSGESWEFIEVIPKNNLEMWFY